jgi:hypothetical protein
MSGSLYAIIFEDGTVKVGMTGMNPCWRFREHKRMGERFRINTVHEIVHVFDTEDLAFLESVLCSFCGKVAAQTSGNEWFYFGSSDRAIIELPKIFELIKSNSFTEAEIKRKRYLSSDKKARIAYTTKAKALRQATTNKAENEHQ